MDSSTRVMYLRILSLFITGVLYFALNACISIAVVVMHNPTDTAYNDTVFKLHPNEIYLMLSSLIWGPVIAQMPFHYLAMKYSAQKIIAGSMLVCGLSYLLLPTMAFKIGYYGVIGCTTIAGFGLASIEPCQQTLLSRWASPDAKSKMSTFVLNGSNFGTAISMVSSGVLGGSKHGWPSIFYIYGTIATVWGVFFYLVATGTPDEHIVINVEDKNNVDFIPSGLTESSFVSSIKAVVKQESKHNIDVNVSAVSSGINSVASGVVGVKSALSSVKSGIDSVKSLKVEDLKLKFPWGQVVRSWPVWALLVCNCGDLWNQYVMATQLPLYTHQVLGFDIQKSGGLSSLPFLAKAGLTGPINWIAEFAIERGAEKTLVRKIVNTLGMWGPGVSMIALCYTDPKYSYTVIAILTLAIGLNAATQSATAVNAVDLCPNFSSTLYTAINTVGKGFGAVAPIVCGEIAKNQNMLQPSMAHWNIIFSLSACMYIFPNVVFIAFGSAERQSWNQSGILKSLSKVGARVGGGIGSISRTFIEPSVSKIVGTSQKPK